MVLYVVQPLPNVTVELAKADRSIQDRFQQIMSVLADNPFPNPRTPMLTEERARSSATIYTYSEDGFPYAIQFVRFESIEDDVGLIAVIKLTRIS